MARTETVLRVFVASPDDLDEERGQLAEIIEELNLTLPTSQGVRLELIRWETHAVPGVGEDAQDVVNRQIGEDYDIFVGMLWTRFGHPTGRAGSGTEEEFDRAYSRYKADASSIMIMFYFKDTPVSPSEVDLDELSKIRAFRGRLEQQGVLHKSFRDRDEFGKLLRIHLARQVQAWDATVRETAVLADGQREEALVPAEAAVMAEEPGIVDLILTCEESVERGGVASERMREAIEELGDRLSKRTEEMAALAGPKGRVAPRAMKRLSDRAAEDMEEFVSRMETEIPIFSHNLSESMDAMVGIVSLSHDFDSADKDGAQEARDTIRDLKDTMGETRAQLAGFLQAVRTVPRVTATMNTAKRHVLRVVENLDSEMAKFISLADEVTGALDAFLAS